jgi:alpha-L-fucosidase
VVEGTDRAAWRPLARGTTIGYARLHRFEPAQVRRVRVLIEDAVDIPLPVRVGLYHPA